MLKLNFKGGLIVKALCRKYAIVPAAYYRGKTSSDPYTINESFHGRFRDECLSEHLLASLPSASSIIESWRWGYNHARLHGSLGGKTSIEVMETSNGNETFSL